MLSKIQQLKVFADKVEVRLYGDKPTLLLRNPDGQRHMYNILLQAKQADAYIEAWYDPSSGEIISIEID